MRTYELMVDKVARWNADSEIQGLLKSINVQDVELSKLTETFSKENARKLLAAPLDPVELADASLPYEHLDQLTMEILWGVH
jgi:xylose isomerase